MEEAQSDDSAMQAAFERLALHAGRVIMDIFRRGCAVEHKDDLSPVTEADRAAEAIILSGLRAAYPDIPCVAEEESAAGIAPARPDSEFFLVDPLDGTKEFVKGRPDFTVNIAFVRDGTPRVGVVYAPCSGKLYAGRPGGAEMVEISEESHVAARRRIATREPVLPLAVVASRSHRTPETDDFIRGLAAAEIVSVGSSLKFCLLADGEADIYPRFGPTMEWDTAAGDAVLRAAGGLTTTLEGQPLAYGKRGQETPFANPSFIARGRMP